MAPLDHETQLRFLVSCIRNSNGGKPDFEAVARDQGIVSKGAAAKRYERLVKQANAPPKVDNGEATGGSPSNGNDVDQEASTPGKTPKKRAAPRTRKATPAKRAKKDSADDETEFDLATGSAGAASAPKKRAPRKKAIKSEPKVKNESSDEAKADFLDDGDDAASGSVQHPTPDDGEKEEGEDFTSSAFGSFLTTSSHETPSPHVDVQPSMPSAEVSSLEPKQRQTGGQSPLSLDGTNGSEMETTGAHVESDDDDDDVSTVELPVAMPSFPRIEDVGGGAFVPINQSRSS